MKMPGARVTLLLWALACLVPGAFAVGAPLAEPARATVSGRPLAGDPSAALRARLVVPGETETIAASAPALPFTPRAAAGSASASPAPPSHPRLALLLARTAWHHASLPVAAPAG